MSYLSVIIPLNIEMATHPALPAFRAGCGRGLIPNLADRAPSLPSIRSVAFHHRRSRDGATSRGSRLHLQFAAAQRDRSSEECCSRRPFSGRRFIHIYTLNAYRFCVWAPDRISYEIDPGSDGNIALFSRSSAGSQGPGGTRRVGTRAANTRVLQEPSSRPDPFVTAL